MLLFFTLFLVSAFYLVFAYQTGAEEKDGKSKKQKIVRQYKEENWVFDILNGNIRFSHGNHKNRDRWFRGYFRGNYECGICHNTSLPIDDGKGGTTLNEGEPYKTVEEIREAIGDIYPYGVKMFTCLNACHNDFTAPKTCPWCHLPGSKPIAEGQKEISKW